MGIVKEGVDTDRRRFLVTATSVVGGVGAAFTAVPFLSSWWPSARAEAAGAPIECDISKLEMGQQLTVEWRGKPVWIIRRSAATVAALKKNDDRLRDPESLVDQQPKYAKNEWRSLKQEYLVLIGICTHLGCSPKYHPEVGELDPQWPGGFFCPCHGSKFDLAGRVFQGVPAPLNLQVPPYRFVNDHSVVIGEDTTAGNQ